MRFRDQRSARSREDGQRRMTEKAVFKVLTASEMAELERGSFAGSPDDLRDGFVHLSTAAQLTATVDRHFAGRGELHVAEINAEALGDALRWEISRGGDSFPHLYGALPLSAVIVHGPLRRDDQGQIQPPAAG